jgi:type IV pilus assembly protein PilC
MPYYRWRGVELTGNIKKGVLFARSVEHLNHLLIKREIALLTCKPAHRYFKMPIRLSDKQKVFAQLATLIDAGIRVPEALDIVANQVDHAGLQEIMHDIARQVAEGVSLSSALSVYPHIANQIMVQLVKAGEESGQLAQMLNALCNHLDTMQDFYRQIRSALLLPVITLLFFLGILMIIFIVIMPRFIDIFTSMNKNIPPLTQWLLHISDFMRSPVMGLLCAVIALIVVFMWRFTRSGKGRSFLDRLLLRTPLISTILQQRFLAYVMQTLSVLLAGGMPLLQALTVVRSSIKNSQFASQVEILIGEIESGSSLSDAMARHVDHILSQDVIAMVEVAEASGRLPFLLDRVAHAYQNRVHQRLAWFTLLLQPTVMIILGLLVALLIFAVYGPILSMSSVF